MIALREVTKRFGATAALDAVSLEVPAATTHVLLGSSGSGKSTVLRLILGLTLPDRGTVSVDGTPVDVGTRDRLVARMGYVVQDGGLYPHLTASDNVALAAEAQAWPRDRIATRLTELAGLTGQVGCTLRSLTVASGGRSSTFRIAYRSGKFEQPKVMPQYYQAEDWVISTWWRK